MQKVILLLIVCLLIIGCAGQSPSFGNFMADENLYVNYTGIYGDTYTEQLISAATEESNAKYKEERDFKAVIGVIREKTIRFGAEVGTDGFTSILGYKWKNIGLMTWGNLSLFGIDGGIAFMQANRWNKYLMSGLSEYVSRNGVNIWFDDYGLFKSYSINDEFNEIGLGAYSFVSVSKWSKWGLTIEGRIGKEIGTSNWRYYFTMGFYWD
jgi:hypothetical protein